MRRFAPLICRLLLSLLAMPMLSALTKSVIADQPAEWASRGPGGGGALFAPSFNPHNPNEIYLACDMSEMFRSTDLGASWSFNYSGQPYNSTYQSAKHPTTGTIYVATSTAHDIYQSTHLTDARLDPATGGLLYSTDKGATWLSLHNFNNPVICLAIDPNNTNRMYASVIDSAAGGIYVSNDIQNGSSSTWTKLANPPRTEGHPFNTHVLNDGTLVCTYSGRRPDGDAAHGGDHGRGPDIHLDSRRRGERRLLLQYIARVEDLFRERRRGDS
jgi:hypothetical protein